MTVIMSTRRSDAIVLVTVMTTTIITTMVEKTELVKVKKYYCKISKMKLKKYEKMIDDIQQHWQNNNALTLDINALYNGIRKILRS